MITHTFEITENKDLAELDRTQALDYFEKGATIFISVSETSWLQTDIKHDTYLLELPGIRYFIHKDGDWDKVIVTRHPCIAEWFKKYKGINARVVSTARIRDVKDKIIYTSGINVGLLNHARGAYVVHVQSQFNLDFDRLSADEIESFRPVLTYVCSRSMNISADADITRDPGMHIEFDQPEMEE